MADPDMNRLLRNLSRSKREITRVPNSDFEEQQSGDNGFGNNNNLTSSSSSINSIASNHENNFFAKNFPVVKKTSGKEKGGESTVVRKQNSIRTHPLLYNVKEEPTLLKTVNNKSKNETEKDEDEEESDQVFHMLSPNANNNNNKWKYSYWENCRDYDNETEKKEFKSKCKKTAQKEANCEQPCYKQDDICSSEAIKKKLKKANKIFYNGCLDKQDKMKRYSPEQQAHATELQNFLKSIWVTNTMCDLHIVVDDKHKYKAHKLALAMYSRKYRNEFEKQINHKDSNVYTICLRKSTPFAVEVIIKYLYTGKIDINPANIEEILTTAQELGIDDLICMGQDYLSSLSIGDILDYMRNILSGGINKEGADRMIYELYVYMMTHLDKISRTPEYLRSSERVVCALLSDSHLCVHSEIEVFDAAMRWIEFKRKERACGTNAKPLLETLNCVRFALISPDDLLTKVETRLDCIKDENDKVFKLVYSAYRYHALSSCQKNLLIRQDPRNVCLKGASVPEKFIEALHELSCIAHSLKSQREKTTNKLLD